jgi:hypothetical protein
MGTIIIAATHARKPPVSAWGPQGLDAAIFLAAAASDIKASEDDPEYQSYRVRLDHQRDLRLALFPMLNRLVRSAAASDSKG